MENQSNKNKVVLSITIISASIILGGFYYASQINKQKSIENQQVIKIEDDKNKRNELRKNLEDCLNDAKDKYNRMINPFLDGDIKGLDIIIGRAEEHYGINKNDCFKKYPQ